MRAMVATTKKGTTFAEKRDLSRWAWKVARDLSVDELRRMSRERVEADVAPQAVVPFDDIADAHLRMNAVAEAYKRLSEVDREALTTPYPFGAEKRVRDRAALRRHRALLRLTRMAEGLAAAFGWWRRKLDLHPATLDLSVVAIATVLPLMMAGPPASQPVQVSTEPRSVTSTPPPDAPAVRTIVVTVVPARTSAPKPEPERSTASVGASPENQRPPRETAVEAVDPTGTPVTVGTRPTNGERQPLVCISTGGDRTCLEYPALW